MVLEILQLWSLVKKNRDPWLKVMLMPVKSTWLRKFFLNFTWTNYLTFYLVLFVSKYLTNKGAETSSILFSWRSKSLKLGCWVWLQKSLNFDLDPFWNRTWISIQVPCVHIDASLSVHLTSFLSKFWVVVADEMKMKIL